tara:strand:- start:5816 stop:6205 length:390 start_codon:yes stop_codon:yes gene_type:complete
MLLLGAELATKLTAPFVLHLQGDLGAGKTTLTRGILQALGHEGKVKSPTFTIVEPYELAQGLVFHFDLYRINDPSELESLGWRDYFTDDSIVIVEWPEKAQKLLPKPNMICDIKIVNDGREIDIITPTC